MVHGTTAWTQDTLLSTSGFVAALAPLPTDPAAERQIEDQVERQLAEAVDRVPGAVSPVLGAVRVRRMVAEAAPAVVDSAAFRWAWRAALRTSHAELVGILRDDASFVDLTPGGLDLTVRLAVDRLGEQAGLPGPLVSVLPGELDLSFRLVENDAMHRGEQAVRVTDTLSRVLLPAAVALGVAGLFLARRRFRALAVALAAVACAVGAARLLLAVAQASAPPRPAVADVAVRRLVEPLADGFVTVMAVSAVACAALVAAGVVRARRAGVVRARRDGEATGW
ncbi:hypothetical protein IAG44_38035 [Streptomyces roseirectus]|uniref:Uncharacterized protein n=1 Tax=Streptomyces roseirectus TaxID=2768066 RepID=A0A7H0IPG9_9ACTN|nr:hypothetical protein [Streptomyces roseirectus]QNP74685.1 hypothetical protein IAG44_38035 [Streptomyces roseirectus]